MMEFFGKSKGIKPILRSVLFFILQVGALFAVGLFSFEWVMQSIVHARKEVQVPNLEGMTLREALLKLNQSNLGARLESEEYMANTAIGTVLKQYPLAGSKVREGKIITLASSVGGEKVTVPELVGLNLRKAEIEIKASQLALGEISEIYSLKQSKGLVVDQDPKAMELAGKGDLIHLILSLGAPPAGKLIIPDFKGKDVADALAWGQKNKINVSVEEVMAAPDSAPGAVIKQSIEADTLYDLNTLGSESIQLIVTIYKVKQSQERFLVYKAPDKPERLRELVIRSVGSHAETEIYKDMVGPGQSLKVPVRTGGAKTKFRIYLDGVFVEEKSL